MVEFCYELTFGHLVINFMVFFNHFFIAGWSEVASDTCIYSLGLFFKIKKKKLNVKYKETNKIWLNEFGILKN